VSKGVKISIVFPAEIYQFLETVSYKLSKIPLVNPMDGQPFVDPDTKEKVHVSRTGKVPELVHISIMANVIPMIQQEQAIFATELTKLKKFYEDYANYIKSVGDSELAQKKG
jgi:hypothetical protein